MTLRKAYLLIFILLLVDQVKIYIKTNFILGEEVEVFKWFKVLFIENEGMAWEFKFWTYGKLF
jgi:signal peptidase II